MLRMKKIKSGLLSAVAMVAASSSVAHGAASQHQEPTIVLDTRVSNTVDDRLEPPVKEAQNTTVWVALVATLAGMFGVLTRLFGFAKMANVVKKSTATVIKQTSRTARAAASNVAQSASRMIMVPLRFVGVMAGLIFFVLAGISLLDIEWIGGLVLGALLAGFGAYGVFKTRSFLNRKVGRARAVDIT